MVQINVKGNVQGVAFRYYTKLKADELKLNGTVTNRLDGSVFILVVGPKEKIRELIKWCHQGSPASSVTEVTINEIGAFENSLFDNFTILR